ncbi:hypothetical protein R1sor_019265 [Riccia sorocarpa]|uniref:Uncharacterized protein n=1 Tax=Riccia sorocarpa TaxID=122646 RepID=A0ABD3IC13_9MARC
MVDAKEIRNGQDNCAECQKYFKQWRDSAEAKERLKFFADTTLDYWIERGYNREAAAKKEAEKESGSEEEVEKESGPEEEVEKESASEEEAEKKSASEEEVEKENASNDEAEKESASEEESEKDEVLENHVEVEVLEDGVNTEDVGAENSDFDISQSNDDAPTQERRSKLLEDPSPSLPAVKTPALVYRRDKFRGIQKIRSGLTPGSKEAKEPSRKVKRYNVRQQAVIAGSEKSDTR